MKTIFLTAIGAALVAGCVYQATAQPNFTDAPTQTYDLPAFTGLDVATGIEVEFTTGGAQSVVGQNENAAWDKVDVKVKNSTLYLQRKKTSNFGYNRNKEKYRFIISAPALSSLDTSSGSNVRGSGLSGDEVFIDTASGSNVNVEDISAKTISIDTSSGSSVTLSGTCNNVSADTASGSSLRAKDLICTHATLDASSGSSTSITATDSVTADASSGSSINVAGNPANRDIDRSSGASVNIRS